MSLLRRLLLASTAVAAALVLAVPGTSAQTRAGDEKIIVSGASGNLGGLTVEALLARGDSLRQ